MNIEYKSPYVNAIESIELTMEDAPDPKFSDRHPKEFLAMALRSLAQIDDHARSTLRELVLRGHANGVSIRRLAELSNVSPGAVQGWIRSAEREGKAYSGYSELSPLEAYLLRQDDIRFHGSEEKLKFEAEIQQQEAERQERVAKEDRRQ